MTQLDELWRSGLEGNLAPLRDWLALHPSPAPSERGHALAFRALLASALPEDFGMPPLSTLAAELDRASDVAAARGAARAIGLFAQAAALGIPDGARCLEDLARAVGLLRARAEVHPEVAVRAGLAELWLAYFAATVPPSADPVPSARALNLPDAVLEGSSLAALRALEVGDIEQATTGARRAFRMAHTENQPLGLFLAGLTLARVRRRTGLPHLTERILAGLRRVMPATFRPLVEWEEALAAGLDAPAPTSRAASHLARVLRACADGEHTGLASARGALLCDLAAVEPMRSDALALLSVAGSGSHPLTDRWRLGHDQPMPSGLLVSLRRRASTEPEERLCFVHVPTDQPAQRVLAWARRLHDHDASLVVPTEGTQLRTEALLAALALCPGREATEPELFRSIYGFEIDRARHQGMWDVLMHRARKTIEPVGRLERDRGVARLVIERAALLPDPRCEWPVETRVLAYLAAQQGATAKQVATSLGVPLRSLQEVVKELVDRGACMADRQGRNVLYRVEDTTFREPTWVRQFASRGPSARSET